MKDETCGEEKEVFIGGWRKTSGGELVVVRKEGKGEERGRIVWFVLLLLLVVVGTEVVKARD